MKTKSNSGMAGVKLYYEEDGVYMDLPREGESVDAAAIVGYIKRKNLQNANLGIISKIISEGQASEQMIAQPQEEAILDESVAVDFDDRHINAYMTLYPPDAGGAELDAQAVMDILKSEYGISADAIISGAVQKAAEEKAYLKKTLVASGKAPEDGVDAKLTVHFEMPAKKSGGGEIEEKVDFRELMEFKKVEKGDVLVSRTRPTDGAAGVDVHGRELAPRQGKDIKLPKGKNTKPSEDGLSLLAGMSGRLEVIEGTILISSAVKVDGDVDMTVGNIAFDGDVEIRGNVNAGFRVSAGGNILVHGLVESAELTAGGKIIVKNGVSGGDKARLTAKGDITVKYAERATLDAGGDILTEFSLHSTLMSESGVKMLSGKGTVIGGTVSAGKFVAARVIGTDSGTNTSVEIGISPKKRKRQKEAGDDLAAVEAGLSRMKLALDAAMSPNNPRRNPEALAQLKVKFTEALGQREALQKELAQLEESMQEVKEGAIHVRDKIYPGSRLAIGTGILNVKQENQYVTYYLENKEIASKAYSL